PLKVFNSEQIRNIGVGGHSGSGKTSLMETMLFAMGETTRIGATEQGNTISDYNEDEIERQVSINTSILHGEWKHTKLNMIDTPGFSDFYGDVVSGMRAADFMMIVVSAADGVQVGTERVRQMADRYHLPRFYVINKLDRENVDFDKVYHELRERFGKKLAIAQFPAESGPNFTTVIDVIKQKAYKYAHDKSGKVTEEAIPGNLQSQVNKIRNELVETVAESDDTLLETYFEAGELTEAQLLDGFKSAINRQMIVPVVGVSATANVGVHSLMDFIVEYMPDPTRRPAIEQDGATRKPSDSDPLSALVFKTVSEAHVGELSLVKVFSGILKTGDEVYNPGSSKSERIGQIFLLNGKNKKNIDQLHAGDIGALVKLKSTHTGNTLCQKGKEFELPPIEFPEPLISVAVVAKAKGDEDKIGAGLHTLHEEDPTFLVRYDGELKQTIASGQGELHLD
ncbi:MAG: GTP-binding protein, partial [Leptospiraceae bacterium]|nr:GTP-binding protein [Leptospiraceae bacterium]